VPGRPEAGSAAVLSLPATRVRQVRILGTAAVVPRQILTSAEIDARLRLAPGSVERISGVRSRHVENYDRFDHAARLVAAGVGWRLRRLQARPALVERALADPRLAEACRHHQARLARYAPEASIAEQVARRLGEGS
jgi:hypothetical protein